MRALFAGIFVLACGGSGTPPDPPVSRTASSELIMDARVLVVYNDPDRGDVFALCPNSSRVLPASLVPERCRLFETIDEVVRHVVDADVRFVYVIDPRQAFDDPTGRLARVTGAASDHLREALGDRATVR